MTGVIKLAEVLPQTSITSLECAACDSAIVPAIPTCLLFAARLRDVCDERAAS